MTNREKIHKMKATCQMNLALENNLLFDYNCGFHQISKYFKRRIHESFEAMQLNCPSKSAVQPITSCLTYPL